MLQLVKLYLRVALKHILTEPVSDTDDSSDEEFDFKPPLADSKLDNVEKRTNHNRKKNSKQLLGSPGLGLLDFRGPKLIIGTKNWLFVYKLCGSINWTGKPLYLSILYKLIILAITSYILSTHYVIPFYNMKVFNENFKNPVFLFITTLSFVTMATQFVITLRENSFDLCPMYKILTTPKLCFVKEEVLHLISVGSLTFEIVLVIYSCLILSMLAKRDLAHFVNDFYLPYFLLEVFACYITHFNLMGLTFIDLYARSAFGYWLLDLKNYLEQRFTYLHWKQFRALDRSEVQSRRPRIHSLTPAAQLRDWDSSSQLLLTVDEIEASLNHMDDHLEVLRSIHKDHLLLLALNTFLANGSSFLLSYHLFADQLNYYHGLLVFLLGVNFFIFGFMSYFGDSWLYYALSSFVQTVEDEYFMQNDVLKVPDFMQTNKEFASANPSMASDHYANGARPPSIGLSSVGSNYQALQQLLLIKKKDVLFCREFLHQFESHLGTPASKMSLINHIHMVRAFITLIAAQIILNHDHTRH